MVGSQPADRVGLTPEEAEATVTEGRSPLMAIALSGSGAQHAAEAAGPVPWRIRAGVLEGAPRTPPSPILDVALCTGEPKPGWVRVSSSAVALTELEAACAANPLAACVLIQVLRTNQHLTAGAVGAGGLERALLVESLAYSTLLGGAEFSRWRDAHPPAPTRPSPEPVLVSWSEERLDVVLNRPEVRNAYDPAMRDALVDALRGALSLPELPQVVLSGTGPDFCSGGDLSWFGQAHDLTVAHAVRTSRSPGPLLARLAAAAEVHGACIGAGIELPAFCSRLTAAPGSTFRLPEVSMGLIPGAGGTASILARIGRHRLAWMALTGTIVDATTALEWGLVDEIRPAADA